MKVKQIYLVAVLFILICIFSYFDTFYKTEANLQDATFQSAGSLDPRIVIFGIDEKSIDELGRWPWRRSVMADVIHKLSEAKPAVIGLDILFTGSSEYPEDDKALVQAVQKAGNVVVGVKGTFDETMTNNGINVLSLEEPFDELKKVVGMGHINNILDEDEIARTSLYSFSYQNRQIRSLDLEMYDRYLKNTGQKAQEVDIPQDERNRFYVTYLRNPKGFEYHSINDLLDGTISTDLLKEYLKDKIVLIGPYDYGMMDSYLTAIDHSTQMHGVEIHANILHNLLEGDFKQYVPWAVTLLILLVFAVLGYLVFRKFSPAISALIFIGSILAYGFISKFIFTQGWIISLFYPLLLLVLLYFVMLAFRYIEEYIERKRITGVFGRYVAPQVVDQILKGGEESLSLGGTRREISALFVDIRGFTPLSEKVQPEEVVGILNEYLNLTAQSIFDNEGTLDKFIGDATMAIFNAPLDLQDHAFKAVKAAWAMKQGSEILQKKLEEKYGRSVQFGVGINTGYAVVGNIGAKFRMDYTAIGDTVNTAARLESNAKPGQILISKETYERVKDRVEASFLGEIKVKGKEQGVPVYQLEGIKN